MYLSEPIECAVPRVEPSVNSVLGNNDVTRFVKMQLCSLWCHSGGGCASLGTLSPHIGNQCSILKLSVNLNVNKVYLGWGVGVGNQGVGG